MKNEKNKSQKKALTFLKEKKNLFYFSMNNGKKKKKLKMKNKNKKQRETEKSMQRERIGQEVWVLFGPIFSMFCEWWSEKVKKLPSFILNGPDSLSLSVKVKVLGSVSWSFPF